ncbi:MAG: P-loop NTPase, partial [Deltaproteobacteria bacterium]|nr:P-loop NTPase [Deltaproteobacteria bacterium]
MIQTTNGKKLWAVGGGKGGIGKSIFTLGLAISLAHLGKKVILMDADLGGANLHTLMGVRYPAHTLEDFLLKRVENLEDIVLDTQIAGIGLICGADDILGAANPTYSQKIRVLGQIESLPADFVLLDLGAGTSYNTLDFFNYSPGKIAVFTSQATSLQNVYGFLKNSLFRKISREFPKDEYVLWLLYQSGSKSPEVKVESINDLLTHLQRKDEYRHEELLQLLRDFQVLLVVNMIKTDRDFQAAQIIQHVSHRFLELAPQVLGHLHYDQAVEQAVNQMVPFPLNADKSRAAEELKDIAQVIIDKFSPPPSLR